MKLSAVLFSALALLASASLSAAAPDGTAHVHVHQERSTGAHDRSARHRKIEARAKMFERIAHMKETPWDADEAEKAAKCDDLCLLESFWEFQRARNCYNRPTGLCTPYKLGLAGLEAVRLVAECDCGVNGTDSSAAVDMDIEY